MYNNIKNLSNTVWKIIDIPGVIGTGINKFNIHFFVGEEEFSSMTFEDWQNSGVLYFDDIKVVEYPYGEWSDEEYQNISIDGGPDAGNPALIAWLKKYAQNQTESVSSADIVQAINNIVSAIQEKSDDGNEDGGDNDDGGASGCALIVSLTRDNPKKTSLIDGFTADKTLKEIYDAFSAGRCIRLAMYGGVGNYYLNLTAASLDVIGGDNDIYKAHALDTDGYFSSSGGASQTTWNFTQNGGGDVEN